MPAKRRSETAGEQDGPPAMKKRTTPEELAVMPNSLEANIGKPGYDSDGVKQIIQQEDKSYHLDEVWRLFGLWMDANGCQLIRKMMDGRNAGYNRWCPEDHKAASQVRNYGSIGGLAGTGMQYAAYAVRRAGSQEKSKRSCFNFKKGYCSRGDDCRFVHDTDGHDADSDDQAAVAAAEAAGVQKAKDGRPICLVCGGVNHYAFECPSVKRNKA
jgi:hypothetical protein